MATHYFYLSGRGVLKSVVFGPRFRSGRILFYHGLNLIASPHVTDAAELLGTQSTAITQLLDGAITSTITVRGTAGQDASQYLALPFRIACVQFSLGRLVDAFTVSRDNPNQPSTADIVILTAHSAVVACEGFQGIALRSVELKPETVAHTRVIYGLQVIPVRRTEPGKVASSFLGASPVRTFGLLLRGRSLPPSVDHVVFCMRSTADAVLSDSGKLCLLFSKHQSCPAKAARA
jgi:hypothetical protein